MKILILANSDIGLYRFRKELIEHLNHDHDVTMALPYGEFVDKLTSLGCAYTPIEFNRRGKNPISDLILLYKYIRIIRRVKPDIILTFTIKPNVYGGIGCRISKVPYISNVTGLGTDNRKWRYAWQSNDIFIPYWTTRGTMCILSKQTESDAFSEQTYG